MKEQWYSVFVPNHCILFQSDKNVLIKIPAGTYKDYKFYNPKKLTHDLEFAWEIRTKDDFMFHLFKNGRNREIVDKVQVCGKDIKEVFIHASFFDDTEYLDPYETHVPEYLEPVETEVLEELLDE